MSDFSTLDEIGQSQDNSSSTYLNTNITSQTLVPIAAEAAEPFNYLNGKQDILTNQALDDTYDCGEYFCASEIAMSQK